MNESWAWAALALFGVMVGSFLNVVVHRLPRMIAREEEGGAEDRYDLCWPPSSCPACVRRLRPWENVPLVSYVLLRGRCAGCGAPIPVRYPLLEALGGALPVFVAQAFSTPGQIAAAAIFAWFALAVVFTDLESMLIPDRLSLPLLWSGLVVAATAAPFVAPGDAVLGAACGYVALGAVGWAAERLLGQPALGGGDVKLFAALGGWVGWGALGDVLFLAAALGAAIVTALMATGRVARGAPVPFGPFLATAGLLVLTGARPLGAFSIG